MPFAFATAAPQAVNGDGSPALGDHDGVGSTIGLPDGFANAYSITGCENPSHCGTFR